MPVRVGFIGTGSGAESHIDNLARLSEVRLTAFCDRDPSRARKRADQFGAKSYTDYNQMLDAETLDAVFICTPPAVRAEPIFACASRSIAVFVQQPPALDLDAARATLRGLREHPVVNGVGFSYRWASITDQLRARIGQRPILGARSLMACAEALNPEQPRWPVRQQAGGGPFLDQAVQLIDVARYIIGDVRHVYNIGTNAIRPRSPEFTASDTVVAALLYENNAVHTHMHTWVHRGWTVNLELLGEDFHFRLDYVRDTFTGTDRGQIVQGGDGQGERPFCRRQLEQFVQAVRAKDRALVRSSYVDAARSLATTICAIESMQSGEPVKIPAL